MIYTFEIEVGKITCFEIHQQKKSFSMVKQHNGFLSSLSQYKVSYIDYSYFLYGELLK